MKKLYIYLALFLSQFFYSQVGIGTTSPNATLDINSTNDGILLPRVALTSTASSAPLTTPTTSEMIYNTATVNDVSPGFYYWDGTKWIRLISDTTKVWNTTGNSTTVAGTNFIGTTDAVDFVMKTNNSEVMRITSSKLIGIGTSTPSYKLDVQDNIPNNLSRFRFYNNGATSRQDLQIGANGAGNIYFGTDGVNTVSNNGIIGYIDNRTGGRFVFATNGNEQITLATNGNLGLGITTPNRTLEINSGTLATPPIRLTQQKASTTATSTSGDNTKDIVIDNNGDFVTKINEKRYFPSNCSSCIAPFPYTLPSDFTTYEQYDANWSGNGQSNTTLPDLILPTVANAIAAGHKYGDIVVIHRGSAYNVVIGTNNTNLGSVINMTPSTSVGFALGIDKWYRVF